MTDPDRATVSPSNRFALPVACGTVAWLVAALLYLQGWDRGEPPAVCWWVAIGGYAACRCVFPASRWHSSPLWRIAVGAVLGWMVAPEVGGRSASRLDGLLSVNRLGFGAVTASLLGALAVDILGECISWVRMARRQSRVTTACETTGTGNIKIP